MPATQPRIQHPDVVASRIGHGLKQAMEDTEEQLDREIARLDKMDEDDIEILRQKRRLQMKKALKRKAAYEALGHGVYTEVHDDVEFFNASRYSAKVACHFYKPDQNVERKEILDKHLEKLAADFIDIRFIRANVERVPFVTSRLNVCVLPSMILIKEQIMFHTIIGFEEMGGTDDFSTADLINVLKKWNMMIPFEPDWKDKRKEIVEDPNRRLDD